MTVIYAQEFLQGVVLLADSRLSLLSDSGSYDPWRDNSQKIFRIKDHLFISFCGNIGFAGTIISFLMHQVEKNPLLGNPNIFYQKGPKLIRYAYKWLSDHLNKKPEVGFIVGGVDFTRPAPVKDDSGKIVSYISNFCDKYVFKLSTPGFDVEKTQFIIDPIVILGSGTPIISGLKEELKKLYNLNGAGSLDFHAALISDALDREIKRLKISTVGGLFQIVIIDQNGSRFVSYKMRSEKNTDPHLLDLEMIMTVEGRWIQRNLITGKEIMLLYPPEIVQISDNSPELFALLN